MYHYNSLGEVTHQADGGCEAIYKHGKDNIAAEALSRRDEEVAMDRLWAKLLENIILAPLIVCFLTIPNSDNHYLWRTLCFGIRGG